MSHNSPELHVFCETMICTYRTNKASIVPSMAKSFNKFVSCLNWEVTAMALCAEETDVIW